MNRRVYNKMLWDGDYEMIRQANQVRVPILPICFR
jgi:hypothetical protein